MIALATIKEHDVFIRLNKRYEETHYPTDSNHGNWLALFSDVVRESGSYRKGIQPNWPFQAGQAGTDIIRLC